MPVIEMDPADVLKALEGYTNELDPERKALDALYRQFRCKKCGESCQKELSPKHAFNDPNTMNPRSLLRCTRCKCLFDPHSGLVLEMGDVVSGPDGITPLVPGGK
jgi:hypothetical protein